MSLGDEERLARLRLIRSAGIGPITFSQLLDRAGSAVEAMELLPSLARKAGRRAVTLCSEDLALAEIDHGLMEGFQLIVLGDPGYPKLLSQIPDPPAALWAKGDVRLLDQPAVAIIGARNASAAGRKMAAMLAEGLGTEGYIIVSGMARGIDGVAHHTALKTGTIAVLAGGADSIYPPEHGRLYQDISSEGLILSEQPLGKTARGKDFPKRNRIVSGLSSGVVVVEAAERSGTLITARLATEQGRDVFTVPGSPLDPRSRGTNGLLRKGAILAESADDILEELGSTIAAFREPPPHDFLYTEDATADAAQVRTVVTQLLSYTPTHRDELIEQSGFSARAVSTALLDLILDGVAAEETGGCYVLAAES
ncbi:MAG: DNA-processing protein DprA [Pseudomonadota bacterium]